MGELIISRILIAKPGPTFAEYALNHQQALAGVAARHLPVMFR
jgi:hypothetical protein